MNNKLYAASAAAAAALFLAAASVEQAAAQRGERGGAPSAGPRSMAPSGGSRFQGRGPSAGQFDARRPSTGSISRDGARAYSYAPRFDRRDGRRHIRRFRGDRFFYGAVPLYGAYAYGPCAYYYGQAMATGSDYWWDRYYACMDYD